MDLNIYLWVDNLEQICDVSSKKKKIMFVLLCSLAKNESLVGLEGGKSVCLKM